MILTGFVVEKKSINLPMVKGTLMETADDMSSNPIAIVSGFHSGLARATIFRKDDVLCGASVAIFAGRSRVRSDRFSFEGAEGVGGGACVELNLRVGQHLRIVEVEGTLASGLHLKFRSPRPLVSKVWWFLALAKWKVPSRTATLDNCGRRHDRPQIPSILVASRPAVKALWQYRPSLQAAAWELRWPRLKFGMLANENPSKHYTHVIYLSYLI